MNLAATFGLRNRELIALVGGGGKSTLLFALGSELAAIGRHVVLTTTTKMGRFQIGADDVVCPSAELECLQVAWAGGDPAMLLTGGDEHKVTGPAPEDVDELFARPEIDYVIVEADGSHGKPLKAPASHEPVIPSASTLVVILMGIDAVGGALSDVVHRAEEAERLTGLQRGHQMTPADCATVLLHPDGVMRSCPADARVAVAITKVTSPTEVAAASVIAEIIAAQRPDLVTVVMDGDTR